MGCRECSRRRIICDEREPKCRKCEKKGIECSGYGLRFRFAARQSPYASKGQPPRLQISPAGAAQQLRWTTSGNLPPDQQRLRRHLTKANFDHRSQNKSPQDKERRVEQDREKAELGDSRDEDNCVTEIEGSDTSNVQAPSLISAAPIINSPAEELTRVPNVVQYNPRYCGRSRTMAGSLGISLVWVANPAVRMLMHHFSEAVAPIMVVLDCIANGYRDIILPLAVEDGLVQRAVAVVAAHHLSANRPELHKPAIAGQIAIISKLREDAFDAKSNRVFSIATLATVLVLLTGDTVTGGSDFTHLLEILRFLLRSSLIYEGMTASTRSFFQQQSKMFEVFGFPLSQELEGIRVLQNQEVNYLEFMEYAISPKSEHYTTVSIMRSAIEDAQEIFHRRARSKLSPEDSLALLQRIQQKTALIRDDAHGVHTLVWVYFVAAAESWLPEHRHYFTHKLQLLYYQTGFRSICAGIQSLSKLWKASKEKRWTEILPYHSPVLVM